MNYADKVAFRIDGKVRLGVLIEIVTREGKSGESKEYHIRGYEADGRDPISIVTDENDIMECRHYSGVVLGDFCLNSDEGKWMVQESDRLKELESQPPVVAKPATAADLKEENIPF